MFRRALTVFVIVTAALAPCAAWAKSFDIFGLSTRSMALGCAMTAVADDYSATFYNPGGLAQLKTESVSGGYMYAVMNIRSNGHNENYDPTKLALLGLNIPIKNRVFTGVGIQIPDRVYSLTLFVNPAEPTWPQYNNASTMVIITPGAAVRLWRELAIGASLSISAFTYYDLETPVKAQINSGVEMPEIGGESYIARSGTVGLSVLNAGIHWTINPSWRVGFTFRSEMDSHIPFDITGAMDIPIFIDLSALNEMVGGDFTIPLNIPGMGETELTIEDLEISGTIVGNLRLPFEAHAILRELAWPEQYALGVAYNHGDRFMITVDATYKRTKDLPTPTYEISVDPLTLYAKVLPSSIRVKVSQIALSSIGAIGPAGVEIELPPMDVELDVPIKIVNWPGPDMRDVISPKMGFEYNFTGLPGFWVVGDVKPSLQAGYTYEPSWLEPQHELTNYLDSDRHALSLGTRWGFGRKGGSEPDFVKLQYAMQFTYLQPVRWSKKPEYAEYHGFDNLTGAGEIYAVSISLEIPF